MTAFDPFDPKTWPKEVPPTPSTEDGYKHLDEDNKTAVHSWMLRIGEQSTTVEGENVIEAFAKAVKTTGLRGGQLPLIIQVGTDDDPALGVTSLALLRACARGYLDESWMEDAIELLAWEETLVSKAEIINAIHPREVRRRLLNHFGRLPPDMEV